MKALILDAGNTRCKLFVWEGDHQRAVAASEYPELLEIIDQWDSPTGETDAAQLTDQVRKVVEQNNGLSLVLTSVLPDLNSALTRGVENLTIVDHKSEFPFQCAMDDLAAVGADRYCNMAAAVMAGCQSALVVDVGTATTFDVLKDGVFLGGMIAPGPEFAQSQLGQFARRLYSVPFKDTPLSAATNTEDAMAAGGWHVGLGGIRWCIEGLLAQHGQMPVFLTGGLGQYLLETGRWYDPHFTLRGAAALGRITQV